MFRYLLLLILFLLAPSLIYAQDNLNEDQLFKAEVFEVIQEVENELPDDSVVKQQDLKLRGLEGDFEGRVVEFKGVDDFDVIKKNIYKVGDKVLVLESFDAEGNAYYYITDYVRTSGIWYLVACFVLVLLFTSGWKGFRSLLSLVLTFLVVIKYIIPHILAGSNPIWVTFWGAFAILLLIIYVTEGLNRKSNLAVLSIFISLVLTIILSWFFISLTKLSGLVGEDVFSLVNIGDQIINFKGLLLAGIIIGALGVLDDVVISQIATVEEIKKADSNLRDRELYKRASQVGKSHIGSMVNTLFLAYAGASLTLLILFLSGETAFSSWSQIINNEQIATEIVRTLAGSIGLILAVPISTWLAVKFLSGKKVRCKD